MNLPIQFQVPSGKILASIDGFLQNSEFEKSWERSGVPDIFYQNTNGGDWNDIQKNNESEFLSAWHQTIGFIYARDIDFQDIIKECYL